jgi:mono/diheme cytochrome c family protein
MKFIASFGLLLITITACDYKPKNQGKSLYLKHCQSCHMENGQGLGQLFPPVSNADYVNIHSDELACIIRYGLEGEITVNGVTYNEAMSGNRQLSDIEIANLTYYILKELNDIEKPYSIAEIRLQLDRCK